MLLYGAMNLYIPFLWPAYRSASQTVSELSAIGAPTRPIWVAFGLVHSVLYAAFGAGVWAAAERRPSLRVAGILILSTAVIGLAWPPMHLRAVLAAGGGTLTDTLHLVWTAAWGALSLAAMGFGAAAFGWRFRVFTATAVCAMLAFGGLTSAEAPNVSLDLPTPWIGVWERLNIGCYYAWLTVFAVALLEPTPSGRAPTRPGLRAQLGLLVGAGDRILAAIVPFAIVGIGANVLAPEPFQLRLGTTGFVLAHLLLALGIPIWLTAVVQVLLFVPRNELITGGPFALVVHPIYTSVALLVLPGVGLLFDSWLGIALGVVLYAASRRFARSEERDLEQRFGQQYRVYRDRVRLPWL